MIHGAITTFADIFLIASSGAMLAVFWDGITDEGMILERIGRWLTEDGYPPLWKKPLGACVLCTVPWATALMWILYIYCSGVWAVVFSIVIAFYLVLVTLKIDL